jgi:hypothetical protein
MARLGRSLFSSAPSLPRAPFALVVLLLSLAAGGCAAVLAPCAGAAVKAGADACINVLCDTEGATAVEVDEEGAPLIAREVPAPPWIPAPGGCDIRRDRDDGEIHIACADGTRAMFLTAVDPRVVVEERGAPAEEPCPTGAVILQGIDVDRDGALDASEVTGRTIECPDRDGVRAPTLAGHLAIHGPQDVIRLAGRRAITGDLVVESPALRRLELPELQSVGGSLRVQGARTLEVLSMSQLASVGDDVVVVDAAGLRVLALPGVRRVGGRVVVVENPALPQSEVEELVFRLTRRGFSGPVELAGNAAR